LAPRRVGKSSVVAETERLLSENGWKVVSVDVQHAEDEDGFLRLINEAISESQIQLDKTVGESIKSGIRAFRSALRGTCGSIGLDSFVHKHELERSINDLTEMTIGAFTSDDAKCLLQRLANAESEIDRLPDDVIDDILTHVAGNTGGATREQLCGALVAAAPQANPDELQSQQRSLLKLLADDGYVFEEDGRVQFLSILLRDFCKQEFPI